MNTESMNEPKICTWCHNCGWDPDGLYCGHESTREGGNIFGWSLPIARRAGSPCGPEGVFYERAPDTTLRARGLIE